MKYDKAVHEERPEMIEKNGRTAKVRVLSEEDYLQKLNEELDFEKKRLLGEVL